MSKIWSTAYKTIRSGQENEQNYCEGDRLQQPVSPIFLSEYWFTTVL